LWVRVLVCIDSLRYIKMSKRYGRNQKRKHLKQIAELERRFVNCEYNLNKYNQIADIAKDQLAEIIAVIEKFSLYSSLLPPKRIDVQTNLPYITIDLERSSDLEFNFDGTSPENITVESIDLLSLEAFVETNYDYLKNLVHVSVRVDEKTIHYATSKEALMNQRPEYIARELASDITLKLAKALQEYYS